MIPENLILIKSEVIQAVPIKENDEPLVDLANYAHQRKSELKTASGVRVREGVADKLMNAQLFLPDGFSIYVAEGYRSPEKQAELWQAERDKLKERHADWTDEQLDEEASKLYTPPGSVMPHAAGSAVDVTVVDREGQPLDMGTEMQEDVDRSKGKTYTLSDEITPEQKKNRQLLIDAMNAGDFVNYATEWWHWSTGDQYWAFNTRQGFAVYDTVQE